MHFCNTLPHSQRVLVCASVSGEHHYWIQSSKMRVACCSRNWLSVSVSFSRTFCRACNLSHHSVYTWIMNSVSKRGTLLYFDFKTYSLVDCWIRWRITQIFFIKITVCILVYRRSSISGAIRVLPTYSCLQSLSMAIVCTSALLMMAFSACLISTSRPFIHSLGVLSPK
jgi:hypothetical protein